MPILCGQCKRELTCPNCGPQAVQHIKHTEDYAAAWLPYIKHLRFDLRVGFVTACAMLQAMPREPYNGSPLAYPPARINSHAESAWRILAEAQNEALRTAAAQPEPPPPAVQIKAQTPATPTRTAKQLRGYMQDLALRVAHNVDDTAIPKLQRVLKELETAQRKES